MKVRLSVYRFTLSFDPGTQLVSAKQRNTRTGFERALRVRQRTLPPSATPPPPRATPPPARVPLQAPGWASRPRPSFTGTQATPRFGPAEWTHKPADDAVRNYDWWRDWRYEPVDIASEEGNDVAARFLESMEGVEIVQIQRIQHRLFWRRFSERRAELSSKLGDENGNEHWLWHGTGPTPPQTILASERGLDPRLGNPEGFFGSGIYLASHARYSNDTKYAHPGSGSRTLLLVRAACGRIKEMGPSIAKGLDPARALVDKDRSTPTRQACFDAVKGGPHRPTLSGPGDEESEVFAIYDSSSVYPAYALTYRKESTPPEGDGGRLR